MSDLDAMRKAAGRLIDPATAKIVCWFANPLNPYGDALDLPEEFICSERCYFARNLGDKQWIYFGDLPDETRNQLEERMARMGEREEKNFETIVSDEKNLLLLERCLHDAQKAVAALLRRPNDKSP